MANTAQARKRARQAEKNRRLNASMRSMYRTHVKKVVKALDTADVEAAQKALTEAVPVLDRMVTKGIIHKNKAARYKHRLNNRIKQLSSKKAA